MARAAEADRLRGASRDANPAQTSLADAAHVVITQTSPISSTAAEPFAALTISRPSTVARITLLGVLCSPTQQARDSSEHSNCID